MTLNCIKSIDIWPFFFFSMTKQRAIRDRTSEARTRTDLIAGRLPEIAVYLSHKEVDNRSRFI